MILNELGVIYLTVHEVDCYKRKNCSQVSSNLILNLWGEMGLNPRQPAWNAG